MNDEEIEQLLQLAARFDRRTISAEDIEAWLIAAQVSAERGWPWSVGLVRRIIAEHFVVPAADRAYLDPAVITARIRDLHRQAARTFELPAMTAQQRQLVDAGAGVDPAWQRAALAMHVHELVGLWAVTGQAPEVAHRARQLDGPVRPALTAGAPDELAALVAAAPPGVRTQLAPAVRRIAGRRTPGRDVVERTPEGRAAARAELAARAPLADPPADGVPSAPHRTSNPGSPA